MRKKILIVLIVLVAILAVFSAVVAMQPADFRVVRSANISAPPAEVFPHVNDFHKFNEWSPWVKRDPACQYTFGEPSAGKGATLKWSGNSEVGEGMMTITDSKPNDRIDIKLDFVRPFESSSNIEFSFKAEGNQTLVTWTMTGQNNFIGKAFCLFMNMDKTVGGDFEKGLANLKSVVEEKK